MQYEKEILLILAEAGDEGLSVRKISRHVHNACNSLFNPVDLKEIHKHVQGFLLKSCKAPGSAIEKKRKGVYRINKVNLSQQQLLLHFHETVKEVEEKPAVDQSLSLF